MDGDKGEVHAVRNRAKECVNLLQQGSAVLHNWFLPVIRGFKELSFLMTDKYQSACTLKTAYRKKRKDI